jgi:hypothetical protein
MAWKQRIIRVLLTFFVISPTASLVSRSSSADVSLPGLVTLTIDKLTPELEETPVTVTRVPSSQASAHLRPSVAIAARAPYSYKWWRFDGTTPWGSAQESPRARNTQGVPTQEDVSSLVSLARSGWVFNRGSGTFDAFVTITNTSNSTIMGPILLVISDLPVGAVLFNATGETGDGHRFIEVHPASGILNPKDTVPNLLLKFQNPSNQSITMKLTVRGRLQQPLNAQKAAQELAERVLSGEQADAIAAASEAYAWAGMATLADAVVVRAAIEPAAPYTMQEALLPVAVQDIRQRREGLFRTDLAKLGTSLKRLLQIPDVDVGVALVQALAEVIAEARAHPEDPESFVPLFLEAIAQKVSPDVNLSSGTSAPADIRFSAMETELFLAALERGRQSPSQQTAHSFDPARVVRVANIRRVAIVPNPCTKAIETLLGPNFDFIGRIAADFVGGKAVDALLRKLGSVGSGAVRAAKLAAIVTIIHTGTKFFLTQLAAEPVDYRISTIPSAVHYRFTNPDHPPAEDNQATFTFEFTLKSTPPAPTDALEQVWKAIADCGAVFDITPKTFEQRREQAKSDLAGATVEWDTTGLAPHASEIEGRRTPLTIISTGAEASLTVLTSEEHPDADLTTRAEERIASVRANLRFKIFPEVELSARLFLEIARDLYLGRIDVNFPFTVDELLEESTKHILAPMAPGQLFVRFHKQVKWSGSIHVERLAVSELHLESGTSVSDGTLKSNNTFLITVVNNTAIGILESHDVDNRTVTRFSARCGIETVTLILKGVGTGTSELVEFRFSFQRSGVYELNFSVPRWTETVTQTATDEGFDTDCSRTVEVTPPVSTTVPRAILGSFSVTGTTAADAVSVSDRKILIDSVPFLGGTTTTTVTVTFTLTRQP